MAREDRAAARRARCRAAPRGRPGRTCPSGSGRRRAGARAPPPSPRRAGPCARTERRSPAPDRQQRHVEAPGQAAHVVEQLRVAGEVHALRAGDVVAERVDLGPERAPAAVVDGGQRGDRRFADGDALPRGRARRWRRSRSRAAACPAPRGAIARAPGRRCAASACRGGRGGRGTRAPRRCRGSPRGSAACRGGAGGPGACAAAGRSAVARPRSRGARWRDRPRSGARRGGPRRASWPDGGVRRITHRRVSLPHPRRGHDRRCEMSQRWSTSRVEAFSDGVFAIAITLLVLEIKIEPSAIRAPVAGAGRRVALLPRLRDELLHHRRRLARPPRALRAPGGGRSGAHAPEHPSAHGGVLPARSRPASWPRRCSARSPPSGRRWSSTARPRACHRGCSWRARGATPPRSPGCWPTRRAVCPSSAQRRRGTLRGALYGVALFLGILVLPKLAAFGYFVVAALAVLSARGEARLTLRGPTPR